MLNRTAIELAERHACEVGDLFACRIARAGGERIVGGHVGPADVEEDEERPVDALRKRRVLVTDEPRERAAGQFDQP